MRPAILTILTTSIFVTSISSLGINCRGSLVCSQSFDCIPHLWQAIVYGNAGPLCPGGAISDFTLWEAGEQIACIYVPNGAGSICMFMQGRVPPLGIPGSIIKERMGDLVRHGCTTCGSVPISGDNQPDEMGILTVNFVTEPHCRGVCYPHWRTTA